MSALKIFFALFFAAFWTNATAGAQSETRFSYRVVNTYPHDAEAFTQGLFVEDGVFYESTGLYGASSLRRVEIETGRILEKTPLPKQYFGEGIVAWKDRIIGLTWRAGIGFVFSKDGFKKLDQFSYEGEGWGLTHNGETLIMSDGTAALRFLDPETLEAVRTVSVTYRGKPLTRLNELEWIDGAVFANIFGSSHVVRIDPASGVVNGVVDFSGLLPDQEARRRRDEVLNGIAYDAETKRLFVTGKKWPTVFEVELVEAGSEVAR